MIDSVLGANPSKKKLGFPMASGHDWLRPRGQPFQKKTFISTFRFNNGTMEFSDIEQNASITEPWSFTLLKK